MTTTRPLSKSNHIGVLGEDEDGSYYSKMLLKTAKAFIVAKKATRNKYNNYDPHAKFPLVHAMTRDKFMRNGLNGQTPDIHAPQGC